MNDDQRKTRDNIGGSGIISLKKNEENIWTGVRDIHLPEGE